MKQGKKVFFEEMNIAKGITAVLVVLGHAIRQTGQTNLVFDILYSVIYSFHMPLFFFISGYVYKTGRPAGENIKRKLKQLLIPYVGFTLLLYALGLLYAPWREFW